MSEETSSDQLLVPAYLVLLVGRLVIENEALKNTKQSEG